jgi:3alpha(or 20beta)-hydroxysteroid dehydrogenase
MYDYTKAFRVDNKVALISGGARGLGAEYARALTQMGASVVISDVLDKQGRETAAWIQANGGKAEFLHQDVTVEAQWESVVAETIGLFGGLDILVNNAGIEQLELLTNYTLEDFRRLLDINVVGVMLGMKHGIKAMSPAGVAGKGGSIINVSSIAGLIGATSLGGYCASKGAVRLMTKAIAVECAQLKTGIRVNSLHPGLVRTQMANSFFSNIVRMGLATDVEAGETAFKALTPMGTLGQPPEIAAGVIFLASDASKWMTGAELTLDGGYTAM